MRRLLIWIVIGLGLLGQPQSSLAEAQTEAPPAQPQARAPSGSGASSSELDFDLLGDAPKLELTPAARLQAERIEQEARVRRRLLLAHQAVGFVALAALTATVIIGHLNYHDRYVSGDFTDRYQAAHLGLAITTTALFGATGVFGIAAPNPYPKPIRFDTALIHKASMALATAGMVTQIILGAVTARRDGYSNQADLALGHVVVGYATWAFMATGVVTYLF